MPEQPPCFTPILKHRSSFRSALILLRCFKAFSVNEIAGAILPDVAATAAATAAKYDKTFTHLVWNGEPNSVHSSDFLYSNKFSTCTKPEHSVLTVPANLPYLSLIWET